MRYKRVYIRIYALRAALAAHCTIEIHLAIYRKRARTKMKYIAMTNNNNNNNKA